MLIEMLMIDGRVVWYVEFFHLLIKGCPVNSQEPGGLVFVVVRDSDGVKKRFFLKVFLHALEGRCLQLGPFMVQFPEKKRQMMNLDGMLVHGVGDPFKDIRQLPHISGPVILLENLHDLR